MSNIVTALSLLNDAIFVSLVNTTLQITLLICLIALIIRIFRIKSAPTRYSLWLFALLAMFILPILTPFIPQIHFTRFHQQRVADYGLNDRMSLGMEAGNAGDMSIAGGSVPSESAEKGILGNKTNVSIVNPVSIAYFIWCAGALSVLCRTIVVYGKLRKLRLCSSDIDSKTALEVLSRLREKLGIRRAVTLKSSPRVYAPIGLGVFSPAIILPDDVMDGEQAAELEMILAHELAHIKRFDYLVRFLQNVLKVLFFFHPLFHFMKRNLAREREHICDDWVIHVTEHRSRYAECLISMLERVLRNPVNATVTTAIAERKQDIPERVDMIVDRTRKTATKVSRKALVAVLLIECLSLSVIGGIGLVRFAGAWPASDEGRIVFIRDGDIWVMDSAEKNEKRLIEDSIWLDSPAWSPDGNQIAFAKRTDADNAYDIYVMNADGSNARRLTRGPESDKGPTWSPDGRKIAFGRLIWAIEDGKEVIKNSDIYVMDADGSNVKNLTQSPLRFEYPDWSPNGRKIAFEEHDLQDSRAPQVWVMDADGSNKKMLNNWGNHAVWSPDGKRIAFASKRAGWKNWKSGDIYVMDEDGANARLLTKPDERNEEWPTWSPDGMRIAFSVRFEGIYVMNADGSEVQKLTMTPVEAEWSPDWCCRAAYNVGSAGKLKSTWGKIKTLLHSR